MAEQFTVDTGKYKFTHVAKATWGPFEPETQTILYYADNGAPVTQIITRFKPGGVIKVAVDAIANKGVITQWQNALRDKPEEAMVDGSLTRKDTATNKTTTVSFKGCLVGWGTDGAQAGAVEGTTTELTINCADMKET